MMDDEIPGTINYCGRGAEMGEANIHLTSSTIGL